MHQSSRVVSLLTATMLSLLGLVFFTGQLLVAAEGPQVPPPQQAQQPPAKPPSPAGKPLAAPTPPPKTVLDNHQVSGILGKEVRSAANENMGRIVDVIVDGAGATRAAIIDFGGFLGVGSRKIAVDWGALHFGIEKGEEHITLGLTRDQVKAAPQFEEGKPIIVLGAVTNTGLPEFAATTPER